MRKGVGQPGRKEGQPVTRGRVGFGSAAVFK